MSRSAPEHRARSRLVGGFALGSLIVLVLIAVGVAYLTARNIRRSEEESATFHATFVADHVLGPALSPADLEAPITGERYRELYEFVWFNVLADRQVVRVKIWSPDAVVLFSDAKDEVGERHGDHVGEIRAVLRGAVESGVSDLSEYEENTSSGSPERLFETYVPLRLEPEGPPVAVAEFYQDYLQIEAAVDRQFGQLAIIFGIGLVLLYLALLPIARGAARRLRRQNDQLERQAERLSVLLDREQQTVSELQDLNRMKSDFVAIASHELRTPLTAILGYAKLLRRPELEADRETRAEFLVSMEQQGDRLFRLIENLLTTARLESGDLPVRPASFDLAALVREVRDGLHGSKHRVRLEVPDRRVEVHSDRDRVGAVLTNLVDNALKYSPEDREVEVGLRERAGSVDLWVRDQGEGLDAELVDRIFERFYRADGSPGRSVGGVGLGLYLVKGLVESLAGEISVDAEVGRGSTFTVRLPVRHPAARRRRGRSNGNGNASSNGQAKGAGVNGKGEVPAEMLVRPAN